MMQLRVTLADGKNHLVPVGTLVADVLDLSEQSRGEARSRDRIVAARVNGSVVDLSRSLSEDSTVEGVSADSPDGLEVLRHSSAHLMAQAVKTLHPDVQVTIGPAIEDGFYYDFKKETPFTPSDLEKIEGLMGDLARQDLPYERLEVSHEDAIEIFRKKIGRAHV